MTKPRPVEIDLYRDFANFLRAELTRLGYNVTNIVDEVELVRVYFGVCRRLVSPEPRQVFKSKNFSCPPEHRNALAKIEHMVESGSNVIPYLSDKIKNANYDDDLLNDWGIHHLHLGEKVKSNGFIKRTGPLLYCCFKKGFAYFIDVLSHDDFTSQKLIKTLHENWPDMLSQFRVNGVQGDQFTDEEINVLRKKNINYCIEVEEGISYQPPGGGMTLSGSSVDARMQANQYVRWFRSVQQLIIENIENIAADALDKSIVLPNPARFKFQVIEEQFYAVETDSNLAIPLDSFSATNRADT